MMKVPRMSSHQFFRKTSPSGALTRSSFSTARMNAASSMIGFFSSG